MTDKPNQKECSESAMIMADLISSGLIEIDSYNEEGLTPLHIAVRGNNCLIVESLLQSHTNVDVRSRSCESPLAMAIKFLLPEMVEILLHHNANIYESMYSSSALWLAISTKANLQSEQAKKFKILDLIFQHALKSKDKSKVSYYKLCKAIINDDSRAVSRWIKLLEDVNFRNIMAESPLEFASRLNQLKTVELLLHKGANPNQATNFDRQSVLLLAMHKGNLDMVKILLKFKVYVNVASSSDSFSGYRKPLCYAIELKNFKLMKLCLDYGAWVNDESSNGRETALHCACKTVGFCEGVKLLLKCDANVEARNSLGQTPLHLACRFKDCLDCIDLLMNCYPSRLDAVDKRRRTILHYAVKNDALNVVKYVNTVCVSINIINAKDDNGKTALHVVPPNLCNHFLECLKNGADLNIQCNRGYYPYHHCGDKQGFDPDCPVSEYVCRLKYLGYKMENVHYKGLCAADNLLELYRCELKRMDSYVIALNPRRTLCDVLFMSRDSLVRYCRNSNLKTVLIKYLNNSESDYDIFGSFLKVQVARGFSRKTLHFDAKIYLQKAFGCRLPNIYSHMIFKYLRCDHLVEFHCGTCRIVYDL